MTSQDFSQEFDLLYNNISSNQAPGLTEYEKSVFLTQAQEALVLDLYKGVTGDSFETTEEVTRYLSSLVTSDSPIPTGRNMLYDFYEYTITLNDDVWFKVFESATIDASSNKRDVIVIPTTHNNLQKDLQNPFRRPNKNRILSIEEEGKVIIYSSIMEGLDNYYYKYLKRPNPIVLEESEEPINGVTEFSVDLPESLHRQILLRAVQMAKAVWQS